MREYLFRGKIKSSKEWRYWDAYGRIVEGWGSTVNPTAFDENTIGQFTGQTDWYGKKIFEGDIVKDLEGKLHEVVFENEYGCAFFGVKALGKEMATNFDLVTKAEWYEVIGNIHDNPELLEEK